MKRRAITELQQKSSRELEDMLKASRQRLRSLTLDLAAGKVKNVSELREVRKTIARIHTFLHQQTITPQQ